MNGRKVLLDTNIVLLLLGSKLNPAGLPDGTYVVSVVTELELLSYSGLTTTEQKLIHQFLRDAEIIELSEEIKKQSVALRRKYRLRLPDAIICATAFSYDAILVTRDRALKRVEEIEVVIPES